MFSLRLISLLPLLILLTSLCFLHPSLYFIALYFMTPQFTLSDIGHCIAVSNTLRENLVLRASLSPHNVSVIPNALDFSKFTPVRLTVFHLSYRLIHPRLCSQLIFVYPTSALSAFYSFAYSSLPTYCRLLDYSCFFRTHLHLRTPVTASTLWWFPV